MENQDLGESCWYHLRHEGLKRVQESRVKVGKRQAQDSQTDVVLVGMRAGLTPLQGRTVVCYSSM